MPCYLFHGQPSAVHKAPPTAESGRLDVCDLTPASLMVHYVDVVVMKAYIWLPLLVH